MKKTQIALMALTGIASGADLVAQWTTFTDFTDNRIAATTGEYSIVKTDNGTTTVSDGILNVANTGANGTYIDLSAAGLTIEQGLTISLTVSNFSPASTTPLAFWSFETKDTAHVLSLQNQDSPKRCNVAYNGGVGNGFSGATDTTYLTPSSDSIITLTFTILDDDVAVYKDGTLFMEGTIKNSNSEINAQTVTNLALGCWAGTSAGSVANEKIYGLDVYKGALTADEVSALYAPIPEPTTATLSLLALAGLAARRRRR